MKVFILMASIMTVSAQTWTWRERADLPLPRAGLIAGDIGGRMLVAGGSFWKDGKKYWSQRADWFSPTGNRWTAASNMPGPRADAGVAVVDGALYAIGGSTDAKGRSDVVRFSSGHWTSVPQMALPEQRVHPRAAAIGRRIFVIGGISRAGDMASATSTLWMWDLDKPDARWQPLAANPGVPRAHPAHAVFDGRIYLFGGTFSDSKQTRNLDEVLVFDPAANRWTELSQLPVARYCWSAVAIESHIVLFGGYTKWFETAVFEFDPATKASRKAGDLPIGLCDSRFLQIGGRIYAAGGEAGDKIRAPWTFEGTFR